MKVTDVNTDNFTTREAALKWKRVQATALKADTGGNDHGRLHRGGDALATS